MQISVLLSLAMASMALAAPQDDQRARPPQCPTTITASYTIPPETETISKCTKTKTVKRPRKTTTVTEFEGTTTVTEFEGTTTVTADPTTVTQSCPSPTCPVPTPSLVNIMGFRGQRCGNDPVAVTGNRPAVQLVSLTTPQRGVRGARGSCADFSTVGQISSLLFETVPDSLTFSSTCRLHAFFNVGCNDGGGSIELDLSQAQRGLCQDPQSPRAFSNINSVQIRC